MIEDKAMTEAENFKGQKSTAKPEGKKECITGAEALMRSLIAEGVERVFGYPGGSIMPVYNALYDHPNEVTHVLTRHEQGAIHAAQGYARVTGRPGVVFTTSGPGATNLVTGIADAQIDSTPLVIVTGQVEADILGFDSFQETDVLGVTLPIAKWSYQIRRIDEIAEAVSRAFFIASTGRPGPVVLDFTINAQNATMDYDYDKCDFIRSYLPVPEIDQEALQVAAKLINESKRPLILSGRGVMIAEAENELQQLAETADIPVGATLLGLSTMPTDHRLYKGMLGMHGNLAPNINTNEADLLIAVGMRFDNRATGDTSKYGRQAKVIHIDIDESEFDKNIPADVKIQGDAKQVLSALLPLIKQNQHKEWLDSFDKILADECKLVINDEINPAGKTITMGTVVNRVAEATNHDAIIVTDVGLNQMMAARYSKFSKPRSIVTSGGLGTMGFGLPAAIGAKMGEPDRQVVLFVGDGGLQMTIQELGTILENDTAVKIVLLNNNFLGNVRQLQTVAYGGRYSATPLVNPDFVKIADAYGIAAENVETLDQLDGAIKRMIESPKAYLLNIKINPEEMVFPMIKGCDNVGEIHVNLTETYTNPDKERSSNC